MTNTDDLPLVKDQYTAPNSGRISVRINDDTARAMTNLVIRDRSATEVVRRAIAVLDLVERMEAEGKRMEFVSADGKTRERVRLLW